MRDEVCGTSSCAVEGRGRCVERRGPDFAGVDRAAQRVAQEHKLRTLRPCARHDRGGLDENDPSERLVGGEPEQQIEAGLDLFDG